MVLLLVWCNGVADSFSSILYQHLFILNGIFSIQFMLFTFTPSSAWHTHHYTSVEWFEPHTYRQKANVYIHVNMTTSSEKTHTHTERQSKKPRRLWLKFNECSDLNWHIFRIVLNVRNEKRFVIVINVCIDESAPPVAAVVDDCMQSV